MQATAESIHTVSTLAAASFHERRGYRQPLETGAAAVASSKRCPDCGRPCTGTRCYPCFGANKRKTTRTFPTCAEPGCDRRLSTMLATRCRKHAAAHRVTPQKAPKLRQCQPGNNLHAMTGETCTCGEWQAVKVPA